MIESRLFPTGRANSSAPVNWYMRPTDPDEGGHSHLTDADVVDLQILVADGRSSFSNKTYVGHAALGDAVSSLLVFKDRVHGRLFDLRIEEFGPEYAGGAFHARFHFPAPGRLCVFCQQESEFLTFAREEVASSSSGPRPRCSTDSSPNYVRCPPVRARKLTSKRSNTWRRKKAAPHQVCLRSATAPSAAVARRKS